MSMVFVTGNIYGNYLTKTGLITSGVRLGLKVPAHLFLVRYSAGTYTQGANIKRNEKLSYTHANVYVCSLDYSCRRRFHL
jgi:hypothetical protein